jgi:hypothetical protein
MRSKAIPIEFAAVSFNQILSAVPVGDVRVWQHCGVGTADRILLILGIWVPRAFMPECSGVKQ